MKHFPFYFIALGLLIGSCNPSSSDDARWLNCMVSERTGQEIVWNRSCSEDTRITEVIEQVLSEPLTVDSAIQVALLNNAELQSQFENVGIARSDVLASLIPSNPVVGWIIRREVHPKASHLDIEANITTALFDLLLIPMRHHAAIADLREKLLNSANAALNLILEVQTAFYELQASEKKLVLLKAFLETAEISEGIAIDQHKAGNIDELALRNYKNQYLLARFNFIALESELVEKKEKLNQLLGLTCAPNHWTISTETKMIVDEELDDCKLEQIALESRFDIQAAKWAFIHIARKQRLFQWWVYLEPRLGWDVEQNPDGTLEYGPAIVHALPIFNIGQAQRSELSARLRQQLRDYQNLVVKAFSEVRTARQLLLNTRKTLDLYDSEILPLEARILNSSLLQYNVMNLDVHDLLSQKQNYITAQLAHESVIAEYWIQKSKLEHAVGGSKLVNQ